MIVEANPVAVQWLLDWYLETRKATLDLCAPLATEDHVVQSSADVSPPSWHLGHTTWFFETFLLKEFQEEYFLFDPEFHFIFNSYYESAGERIQKVHRGLLSRPTVATIHEYRHHVDDSMKKLLLSLADQGNHTGHISWSKNDPSAGQDRASRILELVELGIHHEKQHQELLLMDIKHNFFSNPLHPPYGPVPSSPGEPSAAARSWLQERQDPTINHVRTPLISQTRALSERDSEWMAPFAQSASTRAHGILFDHGGPAFLGHGDKGFGYDNEFPQHTIYQRPFWIASLPVTNGQFLRFVEEGGYTNFAHWLSAGWQWVQDHGKEHPYYWRKEKGNWQQWTLQGWQDLDLEEPVKHISYFEADAFASFSGKRLPTEAEWELAAGLASAQGMEFQWGRVWEWTGSAYLPYPGFAPASGAVGEYNGKFMMDQMVLRGACDFSPVQHSRITYRNFYPASSVWQMSGFRLAEDA